MNELFQPRQLEPETTQAADGMPRRPWTVAEIEAMVAAGIIDAHERFELIGGEVVPMSPKGARHEVVKIDLNEHLQRLGLNDLRIVPETTLRLDEKSFIEPDFVVFPRSVAVEDLRGHHVLLAIEVADSSLRYDLGGRSVSTRRGDCGGLGDRSGDAGHACVPQTRGRGLSRAHSGEA